MASLSTTRPDRVVFPARPMAFGGAARLDLEIQKRGVDCVIDAGSHELCILANFSEPFLLTDAARDEITDTALHNAARRVPARRSGPPVLRWRK